MRFFGVSEMLALFRKRPVLIYRIGGAVGDQLLISAVLDSVAEKYPNRPIWVICTYPELFLNNPSVDRMIDFNSFGKFNKIIIKFILKCFKGRCAHQFAYQGYDFLDYMRKSGENQNLIHAHSSHFITSRASARPRLYIDDQELSEVLIKYALPKSYVVFNIEAKTTFTPNKEWSRQNMLRVMEAVSEKIPVVLVGKENIEEFCAPNATSLCGQTTLRELCCIVAGSDYLVAYEGLLNHVAAALDRRSIVIKGGFTNNVICEYPLTEIIEQKSMPKCYNCWALSHCQNNRECFAELDVKYVLAKIFRYLGISTNEY